MNKLLKLLKSLKKLGFTPHIFFSKKMMRGEITTILTLISVGMMILGAFAGTQIVKVGPRLSPFAASSGCAEVINVSQNPSTPLSASQNFTCRATLNSQYANSGNIACGWSKNGGWPQTGGRWVGANCSGVNCSFGIKMDSATDGDYQLVAFDMRSECGPYVSGAKSVPLNVNKETAPPAAATSTPATVPPEQPTNTPPPAATPTTAPPGVPTNTPVPGAPPTDTPPPAGTGKGKITGRLTIIGSVPSGKFLNIDACDIQDNQQLDCNYGRALKNTTDDYAIPDVPAGLRGVFLSGYYYDSSGKAPERIPSFTISCDGGSLKNPSDCSVNVPSNGEGKVNFTITIPSSGQPTPTPPPAGTGKGKITGRLTIIGNVPSGKFLMIEACNVNSDNQLDCIYRATLKNTTDDYAIPDIPAGLRGVTLFPYYLDSSGKAPERIPSFIIICDGGQLLISNNCSVNVPSNGEGKVNFTITIPSSGQPTPTPTTVPAAGTCDAKYAQSGTNVGWCQGPGLRCYKNADGSVEKLPDPWCDKPGDKESTCTGLNQRGTTGKTCGEQSNPPSAGTGTIIGNVTVNFNSGSDFELLRITRVRINDTKDRKTIEYKKDELQSGEKKKITFYNLVAGDNYAVAIALVKDNKEFLPDEYKFNLCEGTLGALNRCILTTEKSFDFTIAIPPSGQPTPTPTTAQTSRLDTVSHDHTGYQTVMRMSAAGMVNAKDVSVWISNIYVNPAGSASRPGIKSVYCHPRDGGCDLYL